MVVNRMGIVEDEMPSTVVAGDWPTLVAGGPEGERAGVADMACCAPLTESALSISGSGDMARVFAALGDPVRLRLFSLVATGGEVCSCNLEEPLGRSQPTVSHHTRVLVEAGLIVGDKRGRWTWWRVVPHRLQELRELLGGT